MSLSYELNQSVACNVPLRNNQAITAGERLWVHLQKGKHKEPSVSNGNDDGEPSELLKLTSQPL